MTNDDEPQRRAHFRLRYPHDARPLLLVVEQEFFVSEISEGGMRVVFQAADEALSLPEKITGQLRLGAALIHIDGQPLRRDGDEWVLALSEPIAFPLIMAEQRRLIQKYPALFERDN